MPTEPSVSLFLVVPFVLLLLCIAALPVAAPHFWESQRNKAWITALLAVPVGAWLMVEAPQLLAHTAAEYVSFISLTAALFAVTGGIHVAGDSRGTPQVNVLIMGIGAVIANVIGTTGASMVLIRLLLRTNAQRKHVRHLPFFFILIVSNVGGLLTPMGDPPLFLGYLRGVPFFWTLRLFPLWVFAVAYLLAVLFVVDRKAYAAEAQEDVRRDNELVQPVRIEGLVNVALLAGVVGAVFLPAPAREIAMVTLGAASLGVGPRDPRRKNEFTYGPIIEVSVLFAGIFVTMVPALELLRRYGTALGIDEPWQFFAVTGVLSSVLDNAPTYLTFLAAAQGLGLQSDVVGIPAPHLWAISAGAVLMGANTYIGNGPNFMVKAIAESQGYRTDDFTTYAAKAVLTLLPIYTAVLLYLRYFA